MKKRREFLKVILVFFATVGLLLSPLFSFLRMVYAKVQKIILPKGTKRQSLIHKDPETLDTRNLEITPLKDFDTMGETKYPVDLKKWRLEIDGHVESSSKLDYSEILALPSIERNVLLICPGFFANHGRWKGVSMRGFLAKARMKEQVGSVTFYGQRGPEEKVETFPLEEILSDQVFLAYDVNGEPLPQKHGYPLRLVAEDHYGGRWLKYVYKVTLGKKENT